MSSFKPSRLKEQRATRFGYAPGRAHDPTLNKARVNGRSFVPSAYSNPSVLDAHPLIKAYDTSLQPSMVAAEKGTYLQAVGRGDLRTVIKMLNTVRMRMKGVGVIDDLLNRFRAAFVASELTALTNSRSAYPEAYQTHYELIKVVVDRAIKCEGLYPTSHRDYCMTLAATTSPNLKGKAVEFASKSTTDRSTQMQKATDYNALIAIYSEARQAELIGQMNKAEKDKVKKLKADQNYTGLLKFLQNFEAKASDSTPPADTDVPAEVPDDTEVSTDSTELVSLAPPAEPSYTMYYVLGGLGLVGAGAFYWFFLRSSSTSAE